MDSRVVTRRIREEIRPLLEDAGFSKFTGRSSWRIGESEVDVVTFQSFNPYNADLIGCTTFSFAVSIGCYFLEIPDKYGRPRDDEKFRPDESQCHFRRVLQRSFRQPELERRDIWYVDDDGTSLGKVLHDARMVILREAFPWFDRLRDRDEVIRILQEDEERFKECWGFGTPESPIRSYVLGYVALGLGRNETARTALTRAAGTSSFTTIADRIRADADCA